MKTNRYWQGFLLALSTLTVFGTTGCHKGASFNIHIGQDSSEVSETLSKKFLAAKVKTLQVLGDSGNITITPAAPGVDEIGIRATKTVSGKQKQEKLRLQLTNVRMVAQLEGSTLVVRSEAKGLERKTGYSTRYEITVPQRLALDLKTASGEMKVTDIQGGVKIVSASGDIALAKVGGVLDVETASGSINLQETAPNSTLKLLSASGEITLERLKAASASISVQSGDVTLDGQVASLDVQSASGGITADLSQITTLTALNLTSVSGDVALTLPKTLSATLDAQTVSSTVSTAGLDSSVAGAETSDEAKFLKTTLGKGGPPIVLRSVSGGIQINSGNANTDSENADNS